MINQNEKGYQKWLKHRRKIRIFSIVSVCTVALGLGLGLGFGLKHSSENIPANTTFVVKSNNDLVQWQQNENHGDDNLFQHVYIKNGNYELQKIYSDNVERGVPSDHITWEPYYSYMMPGDAQQITASSWLNGEITYSVDGGTPSGVTFDTDTHTLTYNTALDSAAIITIKATSTIDDDTSSGQVTINLMPSSWVGDKIQWSKYNDSMNIGHSQVLTAKSSVPNAQISYEVKNDTLPDGVTFDKANHRLIYSDIPVEENTTIEIAATSTFTNSSGTIILTTSNIDIVVLPRVEGDYSVFTLLGIDLKLTNTYSIYCQKGKVKINFISPNTFPLTPDYDSNSPLIQSVDFSGGTSIFDITPWNCNIENLQVYDDYSVINAVYPDPSIDDYDPLFEVACFYNLSLLYNCRADLSFETEFFGYGTFMPIVFSFYECDYLNYCSGSSLVTGVLAAPFSYAYGGCNNVSNCNASSHCTTDVFFECCVDDGKTVVEDGLNGNSTFNPA